jgi:hypothetical protein
MRHRRLWLLALVSGIGCGTFDPFGGTESEQGGVDSGALDGSVPLSDAAAIEDAGPGSDATSADGSPSNDGGGNQDAGAPARRVLFLTRQIFDGKLGGQAGANTLCNLSAADGGLAGTYAALLAYQVDAAAPAISSTNSVYYRPDGTLLGTGAQLLAAPSNGLPADGGLAVDQQGAMVNDGKAVWTGLDSHFTGDPSMCAGWTSSSGAITGHIGVPSQNQQWATGPAGQNDVLCSALVHLYCVQQ